MQFKNNTKQRNVSIQGLRSFKDTLPKNVKRIINKKGHIYSETLSNWKYLVGDELFKCCYPKTFKSSNKFGVSTLVIMVKRGHEVDIEYSKKDILNKIEYAGMTDRIRSLQNSFLNSILDFGKMARMIENEALNGSDAYTLEEMMDDLKNGVWFELKNNGKTRK